MRTIKKTILASLLVATGFLVTSCGDQKSADIAKQLKTSRTYDGKQIELIGPIELGKDVTINEDNTVTCTMTLGGGDDIEVVGIRLKFEKSKNSVFINAEPDGTFKPGDIKIYDTNGKEVFGSVKVKATVHYFAEDPADKTKNKFGYKLSDITIEKK